MDCAANKPTKVDKIHKLYCNARDLIKSKWHQFYWWFLWTTHLAKPYSRFMCRNNLYGSFPDGRCRYCGDKH